MNDDTLHKLLKELIAAGENEVVEFKRADKSYDTDKIGRYFSALCNEANLRGCENAWLIFGVCDKTRKIVGSDYRRRTEHLLRHLKIEISNGTGPNITFRNIFPLKHPAGRVILFEIPAAPRGIPVNWKGHYYGRAGESLTALSLSKLDEIRNIDVTDWSAQIVAKAEIKHLEPSAIERARQSFATKHANDPDTQNKWSDENFLNKARLTIDGQITRTALLLLGKRESTHFLSPHPVQITWKLVAEEPSYEHFGPPFLLSSTRLYQKIRNTKVRMLPEDELLPIEVSKYDQAVVLEALHNCIAHQDYTRNSRIIVTEYPDKLTFENEGCFYEGIPSNYILGEKTPHSYRNTFLADAMARLNMIDTLGYGIHKIHQTQAARYFPLPDYDLEEADVVRMTIYGKVIDLSYSRLLMQNPDMPLLDIVALDRVQKGKPLSDGEIARLRRMNLIDGRKPNIHVSAKSISADDKRGDDFYKKLITDYLEKFGAASRAEINKLLWDNLSNTLDDVQRTNKISNLLSGLRNAGRIQNTASRRNPIWKLIK